MMLQICILNTHLVYKLTVVEYKMQIEARNTDSQIVILSINSTKLFGI